jgi:hypothetical protein
VLASNPGVVPAGKVARLRRRLLVRMAAERAYSELWLFGEAAPSELRVYRGFLQPGETVVEVGAGFGWRALELGKMVGRDGRVLAFEPDVVLAERAAETLRRNRVEAWVTFKAREAGSDPKAPSLAAEIERFGGDVPVLCRFEATTELLPLLKSGEAYFAAPRGPALAFLAGPAGLSEVEHYLRGLGYLAFWRVAAHAPPAEVGSLSSEDGGGPATYLAAKAHHADRLRAAAQ